MINWRDKILEELNNNYETIMDHEEHVDYAIDLINDILPEAVEKLGEEEVINIITDYFKEDDNSLIGV